MSKKTGDRESRSWLVENALRRDFPAEYRATKNLFPRTLEQLIAISEDR